MQQFAGKKSAAQYCFLFLLFLAALLASHWTLLRLPYFWDEAGYYVPAARDLFLTGSLIPFSTPSNAHPPLVLAYLAMVWKIFGYFIPVTRIAMLAVAAFSLLGIFRLAQRIANTEVAFAATICLAIYPVFFTQSSLAQVDLAAAGLSFWGLLAYVEKRKTAMTIWFSLAVLAKETVLLTPLALCAWELVRHFRDKRREKEPAGETSLSNLAALLLLPVFPLLLWYLYHYFRTGFVFGNPQYFQYNVRNTLHPLRIFLVVLMRLWQLFGYFGLWLLTLAAALAMSRSPLRDLQDSAGERPRIALETQYAFCSVVAVYLIALSFVGGAVLARYMLPAVPLVIIVLASTIWRRVHLWPLILAAVVFVFASGLYRNPPYGFSLEDNLAYRDYIVLHEHAAAFLESHYPSESILTAWPAGDELARPYLGYVKRPFHIIQIDNFSFENIDSVAGVPGPEIAVVFSTKYQPAHPMLRNWQNWQHLKTIYFDYHRDLPPYLAATLLGGDLIFYEDRNGQWIGIIRLKRSQEARQLGPSHGALHAH